MARPTGNRKLKAARLACGLGSQEALAEALNFAATELGLRGVSIGQRQVRRWESSHPPWPQSHHQRLLTHVLGLRTDELGFDPPWGRLDAPASRPRMQPGHVTPATRGLVQPVPDTVLADLAAVTGAHRRLYWTVNPVHLHPAVVEHVRLGEPLLRRATGLVGMAIGQALAESALLAGRIEFFDLRTPDHAAATFVRAMQFAGEAEDQLLGAAILAHAAFVPGWAGQRDGATERVAAARAYARRGGAPALFCAWLDAVEAECLTRCGDASAALSVLSRAQSALAGDPAEPLPLWMDWFTTVRLDAFLGNTQLAAGQIRRARQTLSDVLAQLPETDVKQRSVVAADLAAVEVAAQDVPAACARAGQALDALAQVWYATAMERIRQVRQSLRPWQDEQCVRDLDDRLYGWNTSLSALSG